MIRIGLTGGIASGKSTAANLLKEMGLPVINLDKISREIMKKGTPGYREVLSTFGQTILKEGKKIDRKKLGKLIFENPTMRKKLETITHPLILKRMEEKISQFEEEGAKVVIVEVPLLIETDLMDKFDQIWLVYVDDGTQIERLMKRDNLSREEAILRLNAQIPLEDKKAYADQVITNHGNIEDLKEQLNKLWREIK